MIFCTWVSKIGTETETMLSIGRVKGEVGVSRKTEFEVRGGGEVGCAVF